MTVRPANKSKGFKKFIKKSQVQTQGSLIVPILCYVPPPLLGPGSLLGRLLHRFLSRVKIRIECVVQGAGSVEQKIIDSKHAAFLLEGLDVLIHESQILFPNRFRYHDNLPLS